MEEKQKVELLEVRERLKRWEREFAEENGRKPGVEDVKQVPEMGEFICIGEFSSRSWRS